MRSSDLTRDQIEKLMAQVRPGLRYVRQLGQRLDHELDAQDPLRLATWEAANAMQAMLGELHHLSLKPGSAGKRA